jgi:hypothetical protein
VDEQGERGSESVVCVTPVERSEEQRGEEAMQARADATGGEAAAPARCRPLLHYKDLGLVTQNRKTRFTCVHASENFLACGYGSCGLRDGLYGV